MRGCGKLAKTIMFVCYCVLTSAFVLLIVDILKKIKIVPQSIKFDLFISFIYVFVLSFIGLIIYTIVIFIKGGKQ